MKALLNTLLLALVLTGAAMARDDDGVLRLATTTSTENSGLLKILLPRFESRTGMEVQVLAVGTGHALRLGCNGDVDVVLVHAPAAEQKFLDDGCGVNRRKVMYNDFVLIGPPGDPADVAHSATAAEAMQRISTRQAVFVSRGDDSGTHKKERGLWKDAGLEPSGEWYREAGQGMGKVLQIAGELDAYTLTDRGTWLAYRDKLPLRILFEQDPKLFNPYGVIAVDPQRYPDVNYTGAMTFIGWLTSPEGQRMIADYRIHDQLLFTPMAITRMSQR